MSNTTTGISVMGLDLGDRQSHFCLMDEAGEIVQEGTVGTNEPHLTRWACAMAPTRFVMEAGTHSIWIRRLLMRLGHEVIVANPNRMKLITQSTNKNDRVDAEWLAFAGRMPERFIKPVEHRPEQMQKDLAVMRSRAHLVESRTAHVNHVRGILKSLGLRMPACDAKYFHTKAALYMPGHAGIAATVPVIAELTKQIEELDREVGRLIAERYPVARQLQMVPGVGPITSLAFVLTINDPHRFKKSRQVGAYIGLTPKQRQSGDHDPELRITKAGNAYLRQLLVEVAHVIVRPNTRDSDLKRWALKHLEHGGKNVKKRVLVAVARKVAVLLHRLWVTGEVYQPLYHSGVSMEAA